MPAAAQQRLFFFPGVEALFDVWVEQVKALAGSGKGDSGKGDEFIFPFFF